MRDHDDSANRLQRADPVDQTRLSSAWSDTDAKASLLKEITAMSTETLARESAPTPLPTPIHSRSRGRVLLAAAAAVVALALGISATMTLTADPAYAISETADGLLQINILADFRDGDALARDLKDRGIDARVETVPASPSMVGTVELGSTDLPAVGLEVGGADGTSEVFDWTIDPSKFSGTLIVTVFVEAENGEPFGAAQEIFEPGEKLAGLHCALGEPMRATDVDRYLDQVGLTAQWWVVTPTDDPSITNSERVDQAPEGIVLSGHAIDNSQASFEVLLDGQTLSGGSAGYISDFACAPGAADLWD